MIFVCSCAVMLVAYKVDIIDELSFCNFYEELFRCLSVCLFFLQLLYK